MKNLLLLCAIVLSSAALGQGNLQFNQVISETFSIFGNAYNTFYNATDTYTVPAGKVWKIESISYSATSANGTYLPSFFLNVNGTRVLYNYGTQRNQFDYGGTLNAQPIWMKGGDVVLFSMRNGCSTTCAQSVNGHLSIIEFNIIP